MLKLTDTHGSTHRPVCSCVFRMISCHLLSPKMVFKMTKVRLHVPWMKVTCSVIGVGLHRLLQDEQILEFTNYIGAGAKYSSRRAEKKIYIRPAWHHRRAEYWCQNCCLLNNAYRPVGRRSVDCWSSVEHDAPGGGHSPGRTRWTPSTRAWWKMMMAVTSAPSMADDDSTWWGRSHTTPQGRVVALP